MKPTLIFNKDGGKGNFRRRIVRITSNSSGSGMETFHAIIIAAAIIIGFVAHGFITKIEPGHSIEGTTKMEEAELEG